MLDATRTRARALSRRRRSPVGEAVRRGLTANRKWLPPWLLYDADGSALFERITELPEYGLTRAEREILEREGPALARAAGRGRPVTVVELGAGTASKTGLLLRPLAERQGRVRYVPVDLSPSALDAAIEALREDPRVRAAPLRGTHEEGLAQAARLPGRKLVLFLGSSIGNHDDPEALALLRKVRDALRPGDALLLGTDLRKDPEEMVRAYDDAAGVTAAFNLNLLARINRELGGTFDPSRFRHRAVWNEAASRIEMHLVSRAAHEVRIASLDLTVRFRRGEAIHTESSVKYDLPRVERLLEGAGFVRERTACDAAGGFADHLARVPGRLR